MLENILEQIKTNFILEKKLEKKATARSLEKYILKDVNNCLYLLEIAQNSVEKFYLQRSIELQKKFANIQNNFQLNLPESYVIGSKYSYAIYKYFDNVKHIDNLNYINQLDNIQQNIALTVQVNEEIVEKIMMNFLDSWPIHYHDFIKRQTEYLEYREEITKYSSLRIGFEHGDFTKNNILSFENQSYLVDFEFSREFQPIGFDYYDYLCSVKKINKCNEYNLYYRNLHELKYKLIEIINNRIDSKERIEIFTTMSNDILNTMWDKLYSEGYEYNLSREWCSKWFDVFSKKHYIINIFTIWDKQELVFLIPLYRDGNTLMPIGIGPDLYDRFDIICKDDELIDIFFEYIKKYKLDVSLKYLKVDSSFLIKLRKFIYQNKLFFTSEVVDNNPKVICNNYQINNKTKRDIQRIKKLAKTKYNKELIFEFNVDKTITLADEFITINMNRWDGGPFKNNQNLQNFFKTIVFSNNVIISKLRLDEITVAYFFSYLDSQNILTGAWTAYNSNYEDISPGKVIVFELVNATCEKSIKVYDFGRGAENYKYWFSNNDTLLINIHFKFSNNIFILARTLMNKIFDKLERVIYG